MPRHLKLITWLLVAAVAFFAVSYRSADNPFPRLSVQSQEDVVVIDPFTASYRQRAAVGVPRYEHVDVHTTDTLVVGSRSALDSVMATIRGPEPLCGGGWLPMEHDGGRWSLPLGLPEGDYQVKVRALWDLNSADYAFTMHVGTMTGAPSFACSP